MQQQQLPKAFLHGQQGCQGMPVSIAWVEQLTPCMPTTPSRSGCAWQKALGSNKQGETCVSLVDSIISRSGYPATPTRESPFLGLRRVQLPATGEAWCRDDLQGHPPGSCQLHLGKKISSVGNVFSALNITLTLTLYHNTKYCNCYLPYTYFNIYKLAAPRKGFYLATFFSI